MRIQTIPRDLGSTPLHGLDKYFRSKMNDNEESPRFKKKRIQTIKCVATQKTCYFLNKTIKANSNERFRKLTTS
jgi:hypothetical protein